MWELPVKFYWGQNEDVKSWSIKKAECQRIDAFELLYWRRLLRVPWTARISNQSILKEISPEYSLKGLMLKLKIQYFGYLMWRTDSLEKTLMLGKIEGRMKRGWQRIRSPWPTWWTWAWTSSGSWWQTGKPGMLQSTGSQRVRHNWATELNWIEMRTAAPERALRITLRDSFNEVLGEGQYMRFWWRKSSMQ